MDHNGNVDRRQQVSFNHPLSASSYFTQPSELHQPSGGLQSQNGRSVADTQQINSRKAASPAKVQQLSSSSRRRSSTSNKMTEPIGSASAAFTNNNNTDGWGDDWGDWGDSGAPQGPQSMAPQQQQPMMQPVGTNHFFQPQPQQQQQQYPPQQTHLDQSNRNFIPAQPAYHHPNYANQQPPPVQQQNYQPTYHHQPQQPYPGQQIPAQQFAPGPNNYFAQQPQRPPSHPPASTTPHQQQPFNQTITDSFDTSGGENWNWSIGDQQPAVVAVAAAPSPKPAEVHQPTYQDPNYSNYSAPIVPPPNNFSLPGAGNNTQPILPPPTAPQQLAPKVQVAQLTRLKNETLSPQWSIESQVSQTSSDRSIESGEIGESRSSNTVPSDDGSSGRHGVENYENIGAYQHGITSGDVPDKLDEALNSLNIKQEPPQEVAPVEERRQEGGGGGYRESSFPPPPPSIAGANQQADGGAAVPLPPKSASKTPPLPPMPTEVAAGGPPPPMQAGPPPKGPAGNPFKRTGQRAHIATPGLAPAPSTSPAFFYQPPAPVVQQEITNLENLVPENQEIPDSRTENVENLEVAPSHDRNQYLQTGHLSEEGYTVSQPIANDPQQADDSLPPPGLSRYVPGQQQSEPHQQQTGHNYPEPPPGLDRMIPGTDLENATDLNMERQVDGEVSDSAASNAVRPSNHREQAISDRNLYLVPGESDTHHHNQQRVIPGVEDDRYAAPQAQPTVDIPINEQTRELVMDGENPHDPPAQQPQQPIHVEISREEPIEGGNTLDDEPAVNSTAAAAGDSALTVEPPRKDPSNTSTADESDKDRSMFYSKGKQSSSRRDEDPLRRSTKSKSSRDRYDTEDSDYSDRERRRREREGSDGHRDRKRGGEKEKERRKEGGGRGERDRDRDRGYDHRDRDRNRYDRERGDRDRYGRKYDRDARYETDGSKYETERSTRYDKDGDGSKRYISREEYYRKREERGGEDHRRYRKEKDRERGGERYREEGRKDDRYRDGDKRRDRHDRRYEYEDYRTGSRNGTERDRARGSREPDDRKDPRDPRSSKYAPSSSSAYGAQQYGGAATAAGYYDPYSYYTQHQAYYEQLRRTNPQAYAEWYRTYYSQIQQQQQQHQQAQVGHIPRDMMAGDDRESVHSGRSSANDKERFNRTTPFLHHQPALVAGMYNPADDYHRHFNNQSQPSAMLDQSFLSDVSGQPTSLPMYHHQQQQQQQRMAGGTFPQHQQRATPLLLDRSYHTDSGYYQPRLDATDGSLRQEQMEVLEPERLTPRKFPEIHSIVSISSGLLVTAKNQLTINGTTDLVKILSLGTNEPTRKLFQSYPGPLVKNKTHKKSVIEFCEEQLRAGPPPCTLIGGHTLIKSRGNSINSLHSFGSSANRGSFTLLWNYIILLLRQNGTFVGTDISELLMQNKVEFPFESAQASARSTNVSGRNSSLSATVERRAAHDAEGEEDSTEQVENAEISTGTDPEVEKKEPLSELEITDKFRNYLIYGNMSEALEWATENNLWGHALFLASKVDSRQHANVMMKFANKLTLNDPLQTLYQLLSGRTPSSVTCVLDEKWGDWRPHLAMLMSNSSAKPELIKKSITTLGDSLYNRGDLYAAHFCYLLSDVTFGRFADVKVDGGATVTANTVVRLILLGSSHMQRTFKEFSTNESIMMTEIYEYARSLNEERYAITELQYYKYLLASRMLDYGMQLKCLLYMEQLAEQIQLDPYRFDSEFIRKVYTLGDRLKYYDPVLEKELDESVDNHGHGNIYTNVEDPAWLQRLSAILINYNSTNASNYAPQSTSYDGQPDYSNNNSQYNSYTGYNTEQRPGAGQEQLQQQPYGIDPTEINNEFTKINQQLGQLNLQYTEGFEPQQQQQQQQQPTPTLNQYDHHNSMAAPSYDQGYDSINQSSMPEEQKQQESYDQQQSPQQQQQPYSYGSYDGSSGQPSLFVPSPVPAGQEQQQQQQQQASPYDYWGANAEMPKPSISMPNAVSQRPGFDDEDGSNASPKHGAQANQQQQQQAPQGKGAAPADQSKKGQPAKPAANNQGSGWFGGIWNKLSMKPKNQMILPDDKNPTIVWDPDKKKWVNTEGEAAGEEAFKPPPKMADLMPTGAAQPPPQMQAPAPGPPAPAPVMAISTPSPGYVPGGMAPAPTMNVDPAASLPTGMAAAPQGAAPKVGEPTKVPNLQSNMFKMQRNRTLKKSYVDVFNPSGAAPSRPAESIMAPPVPTMPTPQAGFFVPGPAPAGGAQSNDTAAEGVPQFYNPNQYAGSYQQ
ncbi:uncharacterized protein LOC120423258 isoform X2 [Culex pipiens pallens]|uniref:uncharacterized protein LOC120423258 isoform X2 n=1 Tax=Culex pipiens pallens TaxID=42434 RepID=UPI001952EEDF|nr:uncharacterized protein LOC120423258 isoform X2 [Culex pipiens pallens]